MAWARLGGLPEVMGGYQGLPRRLSTPLEYPPNLRRPETQKSESESIERFMPADRPKEVCQGMQSLASFELSVDWFDTCSDAELLCSVLRWCDTNQGRYFREGCPPEVIAPALARELAVLWSGEIVMRSNTVELLVESHDAVHAMHAAVGRAVNTVQITPWLSRVGRTSYGISFFISFGKEATPLARVATVMVNVDAENLEAAAPIPEHLVDPMKTLAASSSEAAVRLGLMPAADDDVELVPADAGEAGPPEEALVWRTTVRATDCDSLGHINNAKYPLLAAEARALAAHSLPSGAAGESVTEGLAMLSGPVAKVTR